MLSAAYQCKQALSVNCFALVPVRRSVAAIFLLACHRQSLLCLQSIHKHMCVQRSTPCECLRAGDPAPVSARAVVAQTLNSCRTRADQPLEPVPPPLSLPCVQPSQGVARAAAQAARPCASLDWTPAAPRPERAHPTPLASSPAPLPALAPALARCPGFAVAETSDLPPCAAPAVALAALAALPWCPTMTLPARQNGPQSA